MRAKFKVHAWVHDKRRRLWLQDHYSDEMPTALKASCSTENLRTLGVLLNLVKLK